MNADDLFDKLRAGDRRALARAITLVESTRDDDRDAAERLLERALPLTGNALRVGVSGTPGVGKSTFIETLGRHLLGAPPDPAVAARAGGGGVAVLAVDPSSTVSRGSLLGDKTRMESLAQSPRAFVRPQPSAGALGGTAPATRDALLLCEAAGFDVVVVETVGVGQSEAAVRDVVDTFVLLVAPAGGDELQGVKRGVLELVDVIVVNKADGDFEEAARRTRDDYDVGSRMFLRPLAGWRVPVLLASARAGAGVDEVWRAVTDHRRALEAAGALDARRAEQAEHALWRAVEAALLRDLRADPRAAAAVAAVRDGTLSPARAARDLLRAKP